MGIRVIEFKTEYRPGKDPVDWVLFASTDSVTDTGQMAAATWERVGKLRPPESIENDAGGLKMAAMRYLWGAIEPRYDAWKQGESIPEHGTPLAAWGGVSAAQANVLKGIGIKTVEDLAALSDSNFKAVLPNMRDLRTLARQWLEGRPQVEREAEIAELKAQNAAMMEMLAELKAAQASQFDSRDSFLTSGEYTPPDILTGDKPRRGRPPKVEAA